MSEWLSWNTVGPALHAELDLREPGKILLSVSNSLFSTDGNDSFTLLVTSKTSPIFAFYQLNDSSIVVADRYLRCLHLYDRISSKFYHYSGKCESAGTGEIVDGNKNEAVMPYVVDIIKGEGLTYSRKLLFVDYIHRAIRHVDTYDQGVKTLYRSEHELLTLCWEFGTNNILVGGTSDIKRFKLDQLEISPTTIAGTVKLDISNIQVDGPLLKARIKKPFRMIHVIENMYIVATSAGLRVLDLTNELITTLCDLETTEPIIGGNLTSCKTSPYIRSLALTKDFLFFVSQYHYFQVGQIPSK